MVDQIYTGFSFALMLYKKDKLIGLTIGEYGINKNGS